MTKEEAVQALTNAGYPAELKNTDICGNVVWVRDPIKKEDQKKVKKILKKIGYDGTYGWHVIKGNAQIEKEKRHDSNCKK